MYITLAVNEWCRLLCIAYSHSSCLYHLIVREYSSYDTDML